MEITKENILNALAKVIEPDLKKDIVTLDLVSDLSIQDKEISFTVKMYNPALHAKNAWKKPCNFNLKEHLEKM
ncbi:MAG: DUF59 domain-containing protein [Crocinitomicaceae bacterium]|nr:DUF59 domain-containing protein [Crocinitomicaceae bacterium]